MSCASSVRWLVAALGLLAWLPAHLAAEVRTILEPRLVDEMETVRLTLRVDSASQLDAPDFSPLEKDFELLGTQSSSRISSINGRTSAVLEYQINLRPRRTGQIVLPRLKIGDEYSEALELAVRPLDPRVRQSIESMIFFETEFTSNPVYVQAQTVLVRRLYYTNGVQIYSDLPGVPEIANAVVVPLGDTRSNSAVRNGRRYGVIEQRFAIFPEQSGTLEVPAISVTSSVRLQSGGRTRRSGIRVSTEALDLRVLPIPAAYPTDAPWLPAESVTLDQTWAPDGESYEIGDPVSLSLDALIVGNVASAIPPIAPDLPADRFKVYPEAPDLSEDSAGEQLVGRRRESYALIPTAPGLVRLPAITLTWWDTVNDQLRRTSLPERSVRITGAPLAAPAQPATAPQSAPVADAEPLSVEATPLISPLLLLAGAAAIAALVLLGLLGYRRLPRLRRAAPRARRQTRRAALRKLETACRSREPRAIRLALAEYLARSWNCEPHAALQRFRIDPQAAAALAALDRAAYRRETQPELPDPAPMVALAKAATAEKPARAGALPALYG